MPGAKRKKKGAKSPKLSKAEKERLKKEEAERKAQEEEEARLRAEQEAREKEERERQEKEERRKLEEQERARHQAEIDELNDRIQQNKEKLASRYQKKNIQEKWERYMLCDGRPDPTSKKDINTYKNLWKEDSNFKSMTAVLNECELTLQLISELEKVTSEEEELKEQEQDIEASKLAIEELQDLIKYKLDEATMYLMKTPGTNVDPDTLNLLSVTKSKWIDLCIWGNTAKNPRVKSIEFPGKGFAMEIPKSLALADVSIRAVYMNYDHLSPKCSTFYPKKKKQQKADEEELQENENEKVDQQPSEEAVQSEHDNEKQRESLSFTNQSDKG